MIKTIEVTETELAILEVLWSSNQATIRQITDEIYEEPTTGQYATVQKLLDRLEAKKCVKRDKGSFAHTFTAEVDRSKLIGQGLEHLARRLCQGSLTPLLLHLTEKTHLTRADRKALKKLIDQA
ncbi:MAG TPA: BlaI/MecI/CopY family transcriptional regulator [Verrucomicrobiales bacterium]|nr:BlaI/MecI/CopY family transcriptional regulator [Verrucomicrobiales bacterium]HIL68310.1 BlaI/MecI/CopY family transcriptional regulator [Verrucomicrobiota bacterium]